MDERAAFGSAARADRIADIATVAGLIAIVAVAAYARFHGLGDASIWRDEASTWHEAQGSVRDIIAVTAADNYPPLHNLLVALSMRLFGDGEWALRLPSAICGVLAVPALYWVGRMASGRFAGLLAALLLALCYFHIWHSQNARAYALLALTAILFAGSALWFMRAATWPRVLTAFVTGVALLYSHPYGTFTWLAIGGVTLVILLARTEAERAHALVWLLLQVVIGLTFAPWAWLLAGRAHAIATSGFWIPFPTAAYVVQTLVAFGSGFLCLLAMLLAAIAAFIAPAVTETNIPQPVAGPPLRIGAPAAAWFALVWLIAPLLMAIVASLLVQPILVSYYLIGSLPALLLLAGMGLARFVRSRVTAAAVFAAGLGISALGLAYGLPGAIEDWRSAAVFVEQNLPADGCVLVGEDISKYALQYYDRQPFCVVYPADVPETKARVLFAMLVGNQSNLTAVLSSGAWQPGQRFQFRQLTVLPLQRIGG
ncbi:MAG TPA: glycosyltransferase family 39 protein [Bauldia sp.]|nr:glycosyltransferase family 39 protein [Bauldia sp.]